MFKTLNPKTADRIMDSLNGDGEQGRARKAVRQFRNHPSPVTEAAALTAINVIEGDAMKALKQAARI
jgi:hypothetical protein